MKINFSLPILEIRPWMCILPTMQHVQHEFDSFSYSNINDLA